MFGHRPRARRIDRWLRSEVPLARALSLDPRQREAFDRCARRRVEAGDFGAARRVLDAIALVWGLDSGVHLGLGVVDQLEGRLADALSSYGRALEAAPSDPYALANRAEVLLLLGRVDDAEADLSRAASASGFPKLPPELRRRIEALGEIAGSRIRGAGDAR